MIEDNLDIPEFLRRKKGEKPKPFIPATPLPPSDEEKWREAEEKRRERKKLKSRGRIATMLAKKRDRLEAAAGKRWNAIKGIWEDSDG